MNNTKSEASKAETESCESSNQPQDADGKRAPWPDNPNGYVIPKREIEDYLGYQTLYVNFVLAAWFIAAAEACQAILRDEDVLLNQKLIRFVASESSSRKYRRVMRAIISAMEKGEAGVEAAYRTLRYAIEFGFEDVALCDRNAIHKSAVARMKSAIKSGQYDPVR